jgi:hypothetical protein
MTQPIVCIPAWGQHYVDMATRYAVPAVIAALGERRGKFVVYTDQPDAFAELLTAHDVEFRDRPELDGHGGLKVVHREVVEQSPEGATICMLNADIVISREAFDVADALFAGEVRVIASLGVRSLIDDEAPPIGGTADEVCAWAWQNRHRIIRDLEWGSGRSSIPTMLFFAQHGSVVVRCFHLHPFFIFKDRELEYRGTIDDDLLARYERSEIRVLCNREIGFAELSPNNKEMDRRFGIGAPISVSGVVSFGRRFIPEHLRNFEHVIRIVGDGPVDTSPADAILAKLRPGDYTVALQPQAPQSRTQSRRSQIQSYRMRLRQQRVLS